MSAKKKDGELVKRRLKAGLWAVGPLRGAVADAQLAEDLLLLGASNGRFARGLLDARLVLSGRRPAVEAGSAEAEPLLIEEFVKVPQLPLIYASSRFSG